MAVSLTASHSSSVRYATFIGLRYSFSRKQNRFTSVIATVSMLGMVLGVASLIVVLSIMNGFGGELRDRILSLVPHGYIDAGTSGMTQWVQVAMQIEANAQVLAAAPYIQTKAILGSRSRMHGVIVTAIDTEREARVSGLGSAIMAGQLDALEQEGFHIVLGASLARILNVSVGDSVQVTVPRLTVTPLGVFARTKRLRIIALFEVGAQPDTYQAYVSLATGQKLFGEKNKVDGLQVKTDDLFRAPEILNAVALTLPSTYRVQDWSQTQGNLFRSVKMEKLMVSLLLLSVVAVAAFNIVSTLAMSVAEKRRDIAVLRTMGARAGGVMAIFMAHGLTLALVGIGIGAILGVMLALNIAPLSAAIESLLGVKLFDPDVYFISVLPAELQWGDVIAIVCASLLLSLVAAVYPAWRASRIAPAEVLRYE